MKDKQHNCHTKRDKRTNNDLQNITQKTKDRAAGTPLKFGVNNEPKEKDRMQKTMVNYICLS